MKRFLIFCGIAAAIGVAVFQLPRSTTYMIAREIIARVETDAPLVALTFDDGPGPKHLAGVLEVPAASDVPSTFFMVGQDAAAHPDLVAEIVAAGHEIGNHSYTHPRLVLVRASQIAREIE